jgi:hypothetical protein
VLIVIGLYERGFMKPYNPTRTTSLRRNTAFALYLPRKITSTSLLDTFTGSRFSRFTQAVFLADDELPQERELFHDLSADELINLPATPSKRTRQHIESLTTSPLQNFAPLRVSRSTSRASIVIPEGPQSNSTLPSFTSPLARLFGSNAQTVDTPTRTRMPRAYHHSEEDELTERLERLDATVSTFDPAQLLLEIRSLKVKPSLFCR